ncbi:hypothetical protein EVAR_28191_1 [Eumeta japonica]|uniref:Uncharacterized protein n=1 Tax=Eumeta variegata TaxID=151549 RepID=A0A4C1VKY9_EUMVA|nr:hypothetical protein EVAR_28191_1 [Eumeta japonica]
MQFRHTRSAVRSKLWHRDAGRRARRRASMTRDRDARFARIIQTKLHAHAGPRRPGAAGGGFATYVFEFKIYLHMNTSYTNHFNTKTTALRRSYIVTVFVKYLSERLDKVQRRLTATTSRLTGRCARPYCSIGEARGRTLYSVISNKIDYSYVRQDTLHHRITGLQTGAPRSCTRVDAYATRYAATQRNRPIKRFREAISGLSRSTRSARRAGGERRRRGPGGTRVSPALICAPAACASPRAHHRRRASCIRIISYVHLSR